MYCGRRFCDVTSSYVYGTTRSADDAERRRRRDSARATAGQITFAFQQDCSLETAIEPNPNCYNDRTEPKPNLHCWWGFDSHLYCSSHLFCSLAVLDPRVGHTMDVLSPFIHVLCHSDWFFHGESCPRLDVVHLGRAWPSSPSCTWHCSLHYLFLQATTLFPHGVTSSHRSSPNAQFVRCERSHWSSVQFIIHVLWTSLYGSLGQSQTDRSAKLHVAQVQV